MTKFERFSDFICEWLIYPLVLTLVAIVAAGGIYFFIGTEVIWLISACFILSAITVVWAVIFLVVITINKIIKWREDRQWRKEHPDEEAYD